MVEPIALHELAIALGLGPHELVSLVGGGGKTTALFALSQQLTGTVILTTTTKMDRSRTGGHPVMFGASDTEVANALALHRVVLLWGSESGAKTHGVVPERCDHWFGPADHVVVEADGARRRPFTAPNPFEPVVPQLTTVLIACVGADALGRVIADQCHRPMRVAAVAGCSPYQRMTPERLCKVLLSDRGSRKCMPSAARFAVVINRVTGAEVGFVDELVDLVDGRAPVIAVAPMSAAPTD